MILALNTATHQFSLALMDPQGLVKAEFSLSPEGSHFREFMPAVDYLFKACGLSPQDLQAVIVVKGPGSFTGLRVGLAFVLGLCQSHNIPVIGISSLEALAAQLPLVSGPICPLISSRRNEVFTALYQWDGAGRLIVLKEETTLKLDELAGFVPDGTIFVGDHFIPLSQNLQNIFGPEVALAPADLWLLRATAAGRLGLIKFQQKDFTELSALTPVYMRPPDIRIAEAPISLSTHITSPTK